MHNAKKTFGEKLPWLKIDLNIAFLVLIFLLLLFRRFIKGWINGVKMTLLILDFFLLKYLHRL